MGALRYAIARPSESREARGAARPAAGFSPYAVVAALAFAGAVALAAGSAVQAARTPLVLVRSERTSAARQNYPTYDEEFNTAAGWLDRFFSFDIITERDVEAGRLSEAGYKLAILPENAVMTGREVQAWQQFVADGGKIIAVFSTALRDENLALVGMQLGELLRIRWLRWMNDPTFRQIQLVEPSPSFTGLPKAIPVRSGSQIVELLPGGRMVAGRADANGVLSRSYPAVIVESDAGLYFALPVFEEQILVVPELQQALYAAIRAYVPQAVKAEFSPISPDDFFRHYLPTPETVPVVNKVVEAIPGEVPPASGYPCFLGAYYRKAVSSFDYWTGIEGVVTLPNLIIDPARNGPDGPRDGASIYMGGQARGQEIDAGLSWDHQLGGWRPFWRNQTWHNAPGIPDKFIWYPGETVRMSVVVAGPGKLRLTVMSVPPGDGKGAGSEFPGERTGSQKGFTVVFDAWGFGPGIVQQFKRVNAIDQAGNEGRPVQPTAARVTAAVWSEVWLWRGDVKVPFTAERFTDMRCPAPEHFVVRTAGAAEGGDPGRGTSGGPGAGLTGPGAEMIEIYGTPPGSAASSCLN